jgi:hypothetical protein
MPDQFVEDIFFEGYFSQRTFPKGHSRHDSLHQ